MRVHELRQLLESSKDDAVVLFQDEKLTSGFSNERDPRKSFVIDSVLDENDGFCILMSDDQ